MVTPNQQVPGGHFGTPPYAPSQTLSDTTRYLCCAPYVDPAFADTVITEVVEDEQRAVPPSYGFDLDPVVRHCLRARRLMLARHAIVTALVVVGLCLTMFFTVALLALGGAVLAARQRAPWPTRLRLVLGLVIVGAIACCAGGLLAAMYSATQSSSLGGGYGYGDGYGQTGLDDGIDFTTPLWAGYAVGAQWSPVLLGAGTFLALFLFRRHAYGVLAGELAYGAPAARPATKSTRVEHRLAAVAAAQRGNVTVQRRDPFVGSGQVLHGWSFAVALRRRGTTEPTPDRILLDAVALNQRIREAVLRLRDPQLPDRMRVPGVFLVPHVVADGVRGQHDPLINRHTRMPHSLASDAALEAIVRCPQGGLRYYERAVVPGRGKAIVADDGSPVLGGDESGVEVAAHVHVAVEGGMLYAEFIGTVLPPVREAYQLVDALRPERVTGRALRDTLREFVTDVLCSPWWLVRTAWHTMWLQRRMNQARELSQEFRAYDYGARFSVRELAADPRLNKFLHTLDSWKYVKLLDKAVTDAIIGFLAENGVDTSEFEAAVTHVHNQFGSVLNISGGQQNFSGANATFVQGNTGGGGG